MNDVVWIDERRRARLEHELVRPAIGNLQFGRFVLVFPRRGDAIVWRWPNRPLQLEEEGKDDD